ncbi:MAG TPA: ABC transporter permease [Bryobacteraceae bacterium]|jgi:ribose transport system permease protein|nr:ABC transporter permease [Bryobacteraceae bacterium]
MKALFSLVIIVILAILVTPARIFLDPGNLTDILRQVSVTGIIALAMTFVILTAGIDLSVGSTLALATSVVAMGLTRPNASITTSILMALAASAAVGAVNGACVALLKIQPFVVTLATMIGIRGLAKWLTGNANIDIGFGQDVAARFAELLRTKTVVIGTWAAFAVILGFVLQRTVFGRHVRAVGDNEHAALYAGLPIRSVKIWVYTLAGFAAGVGGVLYAAENHQGNPNAGVAYELDAIAAVVIGGTRLAGGSGSIGATIVGTLTIGILTNMLRLNNVDSNVEMMLKAVIIVLAVTLQRR